MLIIAGGVALGGLAVIYRKPIAVGFLGLIGFAVLLVLGLWVANAFTEPVIQLLIRRGWADARAYKGEIWWMIALLTPASLISCALQAIADIRQVPVLDLVAPIARMRRLSKARSVAKGAATHLAQLAADPLENYDRAQSYLAHFLQYRSTLSPDETAYAVLAPVVEQGKAVVAACERAQRIERIAELQDDIASSENIAAIVASGNIPERWDKNFAARMTDPAERARSAKYVEELKADLIAAKTGPITWYVSEEAYVARQLAAGARPPLERQGPRGLGLSVAKVAAAEAYLDGFARPEPELPNDDGRNGSRWSAAFHQRMAIAANRGLAT
jgi:hypothetical protein